MTAAGLTNLPDPLRSRVVLIGFSQYSAADHLPAVANNLDGLRDFFTSPNGWNLPAEHCKVIEAAQTASEIIAPLREAASAARDTLLIYYAGHGILDEDSEFSLSLSNSRLDEPWTGVSYSWFKKFTGRARAKSKITIIDSCFSGKAHVAMGGTSESVKAQAAAAGAVVITSARDDRVALAPEGELYTAFTGELLEVLRGGVEGGPSVLTIDQVYESVRDALAAKGRPRPDRTGNDTSGRMGLAINPAYTPDLVPPTAPLAPREYLRQLVARLQQSGSVAESLRLFSMARNTAKTFGLAEFGGKFQPAVGGSTVMGSRRYINVIKLSSGGMGSIFLAEDSKLGRPVVLKSVHSIEGDREIDGHLFVEARAGASLNHPSIGAVYDFIDDMTGRFIVMEYVQGWNVAEVISTTHLTVFESIAVMLDVLDGLDCSHSAGIIHCDIKPGNLVLSKSGRVKILDFGVSSFNSEIHKNQSVVGTPTYMPPDAFREGHRLEVPRDIYGAGAVLYEMITRQPPHPADRTLHQIATLPPAVKTRDLVPDVPLAVEIVLETALAPHPDARYQSAAQMRDALAAAL
ncbi:caspase, EACC1-associated type [Streptomyces erythrochromogenes]|uniref:caspase, EACC1-associated type n=1 Tax=Streptomyces erythrochromogenes TaxID=285574 RepID=UPI0034352DC4